MSFRSLYERRFHRRDERGQQIAYNALANPTYVIVAEPGRSQCDGMRQACDQPRADRIQPTRAARGFHCPATAAIAPHDA